MDFYTIASHSYYSEVFVFEVFARMIVAMIDAVDRGTGDQDCTEGGGAVEDDWLLFEHR